VAGYQLNPGSLETRTASELQGIARFKIHEGKLEEFKRLSAQCMEHIGDLMGAIVATGSVSGELLGEPSAELRANLADSPVRLFTPYQSM
jgi:hypothetical protein